MRRSSDLESQAKHLTRATEDSLDDDADVVRESITELRKGYDRLASELRDPRSDTLWGQVRKNLGRLVAGGHRATECVALADATKVRMKKARLEGTRFKKRAELGTRVCELAKESGRPEWTPSQVVTALLQDLGSLEADIRNATSEFRQPDRVEA
jgi:hypothetical protein